MRRVAWLLVPALLAVAVYAAATSGEFVWDDGIVQARQMVAFRTLRDVFLPPMDLHQWSLDYYRPMVVLSYLLDQALFGRGATVGPHAMVVLYHAWNSVWAAVLARRLLLDRPGRAPELGALAAGALFAVHPIHIESVCWITGRSDTVATFFALPAAWAALRWRDGRAPLFLAAAVLGYLGAVLSKEVGLALWLALPALLWLAPRPDGARPSALRANAAAWVLHAGFAAATVVYFALRTVSDAAYGHSLQAGAGELLRRAAGSAAYYLGLGLLPLRQSHFVTQFPPTWAAVLGVGGWLVLLALALRALRRGHGVPLLAWAWFGVTLAPSLAIAVRSISETPLAERYLYLPSFAPALAAGWLLAATPPARRVPALGAVALLIAVGGAATIVRGRIWQDNLSLWSAAVERASENSLPWHHLGMAQQERGLHAEALESFQAAVERATRADKVALAQNNAALSLTELGRLGEAEQALNAALAADPDYETAHFNLGMLALRREAAKQARTGARDAQLLATARAEITRAVELDPTLIDAHYFLARCEEEHAELARARGDESAERKALLAASDHAGRAFRLDPQSVYAARARELVERAGRQLALLSD